MATPKGRILCTEDDADTRELITLVIMNQGYEVICTDDAERSTRQLQFSLLAAAYEADKDTARKAGAHGYLVKPVENVDLVNEVARLIAEAKIAANVHLA